MRILTSIILSCSAFLPLSNRTEDVCYHQNSGPASLNPMFVCVAYTWVFLRMLTSCLILSKSDIQDWRTRLFRDSFGQLIPVDLHPRTPTSTPHPVRTLQAYVQEGSYSCHPNIFSALVPSKSSISSICLETGPLITGECDAIPMVTPDG